MLTRIITALVAIAIFAAVVALNPIVLQAALIIVVIAMLYECNQVMTKSVCTKAASFISAILVMTGMAIGEAAPFIVVSIMLFMALTVFLHGKIDHKEIFSVAFMSIYISLFMSYIGLLRTGYGLCAMLTVFVTAWGSDTGAYFAGSFLGKHKLIPHVSPKKTVEGAIGGMIAAMLLCQLLLFAAIAFDKNIASLEGMSGFVKIGAIGIIGSALSQLGDLVASAIKRDCEVKDYGTIFPGHGGFMDRFDSVVFVAPLIYYMITLL